MVVRVPMLPHDVTVTVNFDHHTPFEPLPGRETVPGLIHHLPAVEDVPVGQQVAVESRRVGHIPLVGDVALRVNQVQIATAGHGGEQHVSWAGFACIEGRQAGAAYAAPRLLVNSCHCLSK